MKKKKSRQIERVKKDPSFHILNLGWLHSADTVTTAALLFKLQKGLIIINIIPFFFSKVKIKLKINLYRIPLIFLNKNNTLKTPNSFQLKIFDRGIIRS